jgi:hypothetical protein
LLGWASELPLLVKMNDLPRSQQPKSDDPDFWNVWTGKDETGAIAARPAYWANVCAQWQNLPEQEESLEPEVDDDPW